MRITYLLLLSLFIFSCVTEPEDCAGVENGSASIDNCGLCTGGTTGLEANYLKDCAGVCGGVAVEDCNDECGGDAVEDECGVCGGSGAEENYDCDGNCNEILSEFSTEGFSCAECYEGGYSTYLSSDICTNYSNDGDLISEELAATIDGAEWCGCPNGICDGVFDECGVCNGENVCEVTCNPGLVPDCADDDCCSENWIGDGWGDCEDQSWGCDLTCYDNDGGDCDAGAMNNNDGCLLYTSDAADE